MSTTRIPVEAIKGRGTATRHPHRFERDAREAFDDGWEGEPEEGALPPQTEITWEDPRSVIGDVDSPDVYFERSLNPYRGCEHVIRHEFCSPWSLLSSSTRQSFHLFES